MSNGPDDWPVIQLKPGQALIIVNPDGGTCILEVPPNAFFIGFHCHDAEERDGLLDVFREVIEDEIGFTIPVHRPPAKPD